MRGIAARPAHALPNGVLLLNVILVCAALASCGHHHLADSDDPSGINIYPANYKSDILGAMHAYLNDPTGIRDAAISEPAVKPVGNATRYTTCLKFNAKRNGSKEYAGSKEIVAVFRVGRFDQFIDNPKDTCTGVTYAPFPELQNLPP